MGEAPAIDAVRRAHGLPLRLSAHGHAPQQTGEQRRDAALARWRAVLLGAALATAAEKSGGGGGVRPLGVAPCAACAHLRFGPAYCRKKGCASEV